MTSDSACLIIPAYQAATTLRLLLQQTVDYIPATRTIVVDDGSTDDTSKLASTTGVCLIQHERNLGKGAALQSGLAAAIEFGMDWAITIDADLQHPPESISDFLRKASSTNFDLIIGRRNFSSEVMPLDRRFSNTASSALLSLLLGIRLYDAQCGFRMIRLSSLKGMQFHSPGYEFEAELLIKLIKRRARIGWVAIPTRYGTESSHIRRGRDTIRFLSTIFRELSRGGG